MPRHKVSTTTGRAIDPHKLKRSWKRAGKIGYAAKAVSPETKPRALKTPHNATFEKRQRELKAKSKDELEDTQKRKVQDVTKEEVENSTPYRLVTERVKKTRRDELSDSSDSDEKPLHWSLWAKRKSKPNKSKPKRKDSSSSDSSDSSD